MDDDFRTNLALLCSYHHSVAEVCRKIGLNRQQFNKYLAGQSRPSRRNMRRICDFFGVTETELLSDSAHFERMVALWSKPLHRNGDSVPLWHLDRLFQSSHSLAKYTGFYFRYFYSFGNPGQIIRSLASVHEKDGRYFWKNIENLRDAATGRSLGLNKYEGVLFYLADRIYVMEYETLERSSVTQATLYPSHRNRLDVLLGIQTGGPTRRGRKPGASKVALEFLGRSINIREALKRCGLFHPDDDRLRGDIRTLIENRIDDDAFVLDVDEP